MKEIRICFEVAGLATGEDGAPCSCGLQISFGQTDKEFDYDELVKDINIPGVLKATFLDEYVKPEDVRIISPDEYDERFGDDGVKSSVELLGSEEKSL